MAITLLKESQLASYSTANITGRVEDIASVWNNQASFASAMHAGTVGYHSSVVTYVKVCPPSVLTEFCYFTMRFPRWAQDIDGTNSVMIDVVFSISAVPGSDQDVAVRFNLSTYDGSDDVSTVGTVDKLVSIPVSGAGTNRIYTTTASVPAATLPVTGSSEKYLVVNGARYWTSGGPDTYTGSWNAIQVTLRSGRKSGY